MPQYPNYYHPSLSIFKPSSKLSEISDSGDVLHSKKLFIKEQQAQHSAVNNKNIFINNIQTLRELSSLDYDLSTLPVVHQHENPCCQIIPFLHMIQAQLDFPLDYEKFLQCIPAEPLPPERLPINWYKIPTDKDSTTDHYRIAQLLFSGKCFKVHESVETPCNEMQFFDEIDDKDCSECHKGFGIYIKVIFLNISSPEYINIDCDKLFFPRCFVIHGIDAVKFSLMNLTYSNPNFPDPLTWDDLKDMNAANLIELAQNYGIELPPQDEWYKNAHALTALSCSKDENDCYEIILKNSYGNKNHITTYKTCSANFWKDQFQKSIFPRILLKINKYCVIKRSISDNEYSECLNNECRKILYSYYDPNSTNDCKCKDDNVTFPTETTTTPTPLFFNYNPPL